MHVTMNSTQARQKAINQRYMMVDPGNALETTGINVFNDKSYLSGLTPTGAQSDALSHISAPQKK